MSITINGEQQQLDPGTTLRDVVAQRLDRPVRDDGRAEDGKSLGVAVAVDDVVVPRSQWAQHVLDDGARCEFVTAVQGG